VIGTRIRSVDRFQVLGVLLIVIVVAATATWRASGSPTPQVLGPVNSKIEVDPVPEKVDNRPEAVKVAEAVLAADLQVVATELPAGVTMTSPSPDIRVVCAQSVCAALRGSSKSYAYARGGRAAAKALALLLHPKSAGTSQSAQGGR
jgi:hypothetical protein